jgi:hypothetical protein
LGWLSAAIELRNTTVAGNRQLARMKPAIAVVVLLSSLLAVSSAAEKFDFFYLVQQVTNEASIHPRRPINS